MKKKLLAAMLAVLCLLLCGCSFHNKTLDAQMRAVVAALNEDDEAAFAELLYLPEPGEEDVHALYSGLHELWIVSDPDTARMRNIQINTTNGEKHYTGDYIFDSGMALRISYYSGDFGSGIEEIAVGAHEAQSDTPLPRFDAHLIPLLASGVLSLIAVVVTIVDIVRKKPRNYGWFIVLAIVTFRLNLNDWRIVLPLGAIVWWCIRSSVLKNNGAAGRYPPAGHTYTDTSRDPWEL